MSTSISPDELAYRQLAEWCARIERRRRLAASWEGIAVTEDTSRTPNDDATARDGNAPNRVA